MVNIYWSVDNFSGLHCLKRKRLWRNEGRRALSISILIVAQACNNSNYNYITLTVIIKLEILRKLNNCSCRSYFSSIFSSNDLHQLKKNSVFYLTSVDVFIQYPGKKQQRCLRRTLPWEIWSWGLVVTAETILSPSGRRQRMFNLKMYGIVKSMISL